MRIIDEIVFADAGLATCVIATGIEIARDVTSLSCYYSIADLGGLEALGLNAAISHILDGIADTDRLD